MSLLRTLQRSVFRVEEMVVRGRSALGPLPAASSGLERPLELMELESRILLSGVPLAGDALVQEAFDDGSQAVDDVQVVEAENQIAYSQTVQIEPRDRLIAKFAIAHSSANTANRLVGWRLTETGWGPFIQENILPAIDAGFTRIELHNPFGRGSDDRFMSFDQYLDAVVETPKLAEGFADFWRPITDSGIEVIAYIGSPRHNAIQNALLDDPAAWWDRALAAVQPLVDAGMSVGLDASANAAPDSLDAALAQHLRDQGVRVYVEARPAATSTQWFDYPIMIIVGTWDSQSPEVQPNQVGKFAWEYELTGEVVRIIRANFGEDVDILKDVLSEGHTATLNWRSDWRQKVGDTTLDQALEDVGIASLPTRISLRGPNAASDPLAYTITSGPAHGSVTVHPQNDALVTYVPDPYYSGTDAFTFQVADDQGRTETATISLSIRGFTRPPTPPRAASPAIAGDPMIRIRDLVDAQVGLRQGEVSMIPADLARNATGLVGSSRSLAEAAADGVVSTDAVDGRDRSHQFLGIDLAVLPTAKSHAFDSLRTLAELAPDGGSRNVIDGYFATPRSYERAPLATYIRDGHRWSSDHGWQPDPADVAAEGVASLLSADRPVADAEPAAPLLEEALAEDPLLPGRGDKPAMLDKDVTPDAGIVEEAGIASIAKTASNQAEAEGSLMAWLASLWEALEQWSWSRD